MCRLRVHYSEVALAEIACAAFVRDGLVLLVKRASHKTWYPNHWDLVGGHVEPGESVEAALVREAQEEVGLTPVRFRWIAELSELQTSDDFRTRYHVYAVTAWEGGEPTLLGDEHTAMQWVTASEASTLEGIAHPQYLHVFRELSQSIASAAFRPGGNTG
jgi:8-oxo-dGTP pyrophosphatase MutT (NUDIX family)